MPVGRSTARTHATAGSQLPTSSTAAGSLAAGAEGEALGHARAFSWVWARARGAHGIRSPWSLPRAPGQQRCWGRGAHPRAPRGPSVGLIWGCGAPFGQHPQPRHPLCGHAGPTAQTALSPPCRPGPVSIPCPAVRSDPGRAQAGVGRPQGLVPSLEPLARDTVGLFPSQKLPDRAFGNFPT